MCSLLPRTFSKKKRKIGWQPSQDKIRDSVINHVKNPSEINFAVQARRSKLEKYKLPYLSFAITEDILYKVTSVLQAIDICFSINRILNLQYPLESEHIWLFLQQASYELQTKHDNFPVIIDLANKVKNRLNIRN